MTREQEVRAYLLGKCRLTTLAADAPIFTSGLIDSFGVLELIVFLEDTFGVSIDTARHNLTDFDTIAGILVVVGRLESAGGV